MVNWQIKSLETNKPYFVVLGGRSFEVKTHQDAIKLCRIKEKLEEKRKRKRKV
jgi:hypothetical protein